MFQDTYTGICSCAYEKASERDKQGKPMSLIVQSKILVPKDLKDRDDDSL